MKNCLQKLLSDQTNVDKKIIKTSQAVSKEFGYTKIKVLSRYFPILRRKGNFHQYHANCANLGTNKWN